LKGFATVQYLVKRYLKLYLGIHMNPHGYRHLAAKFLLDESPGAYREVQELLGHKKLETTAIFYAGLDTRRAGGLHASLLDAALVSTTSSKVSSELSAARQGCTND
jgi:site-specific recombinase XerC